MNHYEITKVLSKLWEKSVQLHREGNKSPDTHFSIEEKSELSSLGLGVMDVYDYTEDFVSSEDPDYGTFLLINMERVLYFQEVLQQKPATAQLTGDDLPPKTAAVNDIEWLPRILAKARGKLEGTLSDEIMYGCGGDRRFLRSCGIHPVELLRKVSREPDDKQVILWVESRRKLVGF